MRFLFIVEQRYRDDFMPRAVADQLADWGHDVALFEPQTTITCLSEMCSTDFARYDAFVLKTVSEGPGCSVLDAAAAVGIPTINDAQAVRAVRDKAVSAALASARGLPFPRTYFVTCPELLDQITPDQYPLVVKPINGSSGRSVHLVHSPRELAGLEVGQDGFLLAQRYVANQGFDIKLYNTGQEVFAVRRTSPLHPGKGRVERLVRVTRELREIALEVGRIFDLQIYGVDVIESSRGWVVVDINDFPGFRQMDGAAASVAQTIVGITRRARVASKALPDVEA